MAADEILYFSDSSTAFNSVHGVEGWIEPENLSSRLAAKLGFTEDGSCATGSASRASSAAS